MIDYRDLLIESMEKHCGKSTLERIKLEAMDKLIKLTLEQRNQITLQELKDKDITDRPF